MLNNAIQLECTLKFVDELTLILQTYKSICLNVNATVKVMDEIICIFQLYTTHSDTIIIEVIFKLHNSETNIFENRPL